MDPHVVDGNTLTQSRCRSAADKLRVILTPLADLDLSDGEQHFVITVLELLAELEQGNVLASISIRHVAASTRTRHPRLSGACDDIVVLLD